MDILAHGQSVAEREEEGRPIPVKDAAGDKMFADDGETPVTITVKGSFSSTYRRKADANRDAMLKRRSTEIDGDEFEQRALDLTVACIKGWSGFTAGDAEYPFNKNNAVALLKACPWIRAQVEAAMHDHAAFFAKS